jgi:hypothetical protein
MVWCGLCCQILEMIYANVYSGGFMRHLFNLDTRVPLCVRMRSVRFCLVSATLIGFYRENPGNLNRIIEFAAGSLR